MSGDNWALKAIEREAMSRAVADLQRFPQTFNVFGHPLTMEQIAWLALDYQIRTGKLPSDIDARAPRPATEGAPITERAQP